MTRRFITTELAATQRRLAFIEGGFTAIVAIAAIYFIAVFCGLSPIAG